MNVRSELESRISAALTVAADSDAPLPAIVAPAAHAKFGDYQANGVMAAAKRAGTNLRELAAAVVRRDDLADMADSIQVAGPGFINITLSTRFLQELLTRAGNDPERLGVRPVPYPQTVVVDYSSPNLAKEMHAGHVRPTIIGDCLANVLEFLGHEVIRQNHYGDWGTQFGMLIAQLKRTAADLSQVRIADLDEFYRRAKELFDSDPDFADQARREVVALQSGDPDSRQAWEVFMQESKRHCREVYGRLNVGLTAEHERPESSYNPVLGDIVAQLQASDMIEESDGALCIFLDEFKGRDDEPLPLIVRKSDGGYLYATTDLAAIKRRGRELKADRILYVTGAGQALHFAQVFAVARRARFVDEGTSLEHIAFGMMLGKDGRPFKTREGGTVKLMDLLDEAEQRAAQVVREKNPDLSAPRASEIAHVVGIGAVKYADLSMDRTSDYRFSWSKMLALQGNTAPYMQYAYARVRSIFRRGATGDAGLTDRPVTLSEPAERELAKHIVRLEETLAAVAAECKPNILTAYLFDLASAFSVFYESCPVLKADPHVRDSRLRLCDLTARVIKCGLELLGIAVVEQM